MVAKPNPVGEREAEQELDRRSSALDRRESALDERESDINKQSEKLGIVLARRQQGERIRAAVHEAIRLAKPTLTLAAAALIVANVLSVIGNSGKETTLDSSFTSGFSELLHSEEEYYKDPIYLKNWIRTIYEEENSGLLTGAWIDAYPGYITFPYSKYDEEDIIEDLYFKGNRIFSTYNNNGDAAIATEKENKPDEIATIEKALAALKKDRDTIVKSVEDIPSKIVKSKETITESVEQISQQYIEINQTKLALGALRGKYQALSEAINTILTAENVTDDEKNLLTPIKSRVDAIANDLLKNIKLLGELKVKLEGIQTELINITFQLDTPEPNTEEVRKNIDSRSKSLKEISESLTKIRKFLVESLSKTQSSRVELSGNLATHLQDVEPDFAALEVQINLLKTGIDSHQVKITEIQNEIVKPNQDLTGIETSITTKEAELKKAQERQEYLDEYFKIDNDKNDLRNNLLQFIFDNPEDPQAKYWLDMIIRMHIYEANTKTLSDNENIQQAGIQFGIAAGFRYIEEALEQKSTPPNNTTANFNVTNRQAVQEFIKERIPLYQESVNPTALEARGRI